MSELARAAPKPRAKSEPAPQPAQAQRGIVREAILLSAVSAAVSTVVAAIVSSYLNRVHENAEEARARRVNPSSPAEWTKRIVVDGVTTPRNPPFRATSPEPPRAAAPEPPRGGSPTFKLDFDPGQRP